MQFPWPLCIWDYLVSPMLHGYNSSGLTFFLLCDHRFLSGTLSRADLLCTGWSPLLLDKYTHVTYMLTRARRNEWSGEQEVCWWSRFGYLILFPVPKHHWPYDALRLFFSPWFANFLFPRRNSFHDIYLTLNNPKGKAPHMHYSTCSVSWFPGSFKSEVKYCRGSEWNRRRICVKHSKSGSVGCKNLCMLKEISN